MVQHRDQICRLFLRRALYKQVISGDAMVKVFAIATDGGALAGQRVANFSYSCPVIVITLLLSTVADDIVDAPISIDSCRPDPAS